MHKPTSLHNLFKVEYVYTEKNQSSQNKLDFSRVFPSYLLRMPAIMHGMPWICCCRCYIVILIQHGLVERHSQTNHFRHSTRIVHTTIVINREGFAFDLNRTCVVVVVVVFSPAQRPITMTHAINIKMPATTAKPTEPTTILPFIHQQPSRFSVANSSIYSEGLV